MHLALRRAVTQDITAPPVRASCRPPDASGAAPGRPVPARNSAPPPLVHGRTGARP